MPRRTKPTTANTTLRAVPLFQGCSDPELARLDSLTTEVTLRSGQVLCTEGAPGHEFLLLLEGSASVESSSGLRSDLGSGDFIGELALIDQGPRTATVTMTTDGRALVLSGSEFRQVLHEAPTIAVGMLPILCARARSSMARSER